MAKNRDYKNGCQLTPDFESKKAKAVVGVIMGSQSDWPYTQPCCDMLEQLTIPFEYGVTSAHRTPSRMRLYADTAALRGVQIIIACAGGSAHLPGMVASETSLPVLGVAPKKTDEHAVGSMIAMPAGIPLAYLGGGSGEYKNAGAVNAAIFAARILSLNNELISASLSTYEINLEKDVPYNCHDVGE